MMTDPHVWWYVTRSSAIIAWVLMTLAVLWGILLSTRLLQRVDNPGWLQDLHKYFGGMSLIMVALHMVSLMLDGYVSFSFVEVLVPFGTDFKPLPVALGILAFYMLIAVQGTSLIMNRLPRRLWKIVHYLSYASILLVAVHAGLVGTEVGSWWYQAVAVLLITVSMLAVVVRIVLGNRSSAVAAKARAAQDASTGAPLVSTTVAEPQVALAAAPHDRLHMIVVAATRLADGVIGLRLAARDRSVLPTWAPGSHITLFLPNGLERQYSLCGDPTDRTHFEVAVVRVDDSALGGSRWIHENLGVGDALDISHPRNNFELEPAREYVFIAGGIGITPIKAMIESLPASRYWKLLYVGRSDTSMAFAAELAAAYPHRVVLHPSSSNSGHLDFAPFVTESSHIYACGPASLLEAVSSLAPHDRVHIERFIPVIRASAGGSRPISVTCDRNGETLEVAAGVSVLEALEASGRPIIGSCRKGVCGTCEVRVLEGTPEHLDSVMDDEEKDELGVMYPCVSRAAGSTLVLDI
jgi:ferredoxin-NADP reductase/DMSO/TMAO reductase YedYZ heme-binding membrane subunit